MTTAAKATVDVRNMSIAHLREDLTGLLGAAAHLAADDQFFILGQYLLNNLLKVRIGRHLASPHMEKGDIDGPNSVPGHEFRDRPNVQIDGLRILVQNLFGLGGCDLGDGHRILLSHPLKTPVFLAQLLFVGLLTLDVKSQKKRNLYFRRAIGFRLQD